MKLKCTAKLPRITKTLRQWCGDQFQAETLVRLPVKPALGAIPMLCASNVETMCQLYGGRFAEGWLLWENSGVMISTEHHITWEDPTGQLVDPTPQDGFGHVLFADTGRRFQIETEQFNVFCTQWNTEHSRIDDDCNPYLLLDDHPKVQQLAANQQETQCGLWRYRNEQMLASEAIDKTVINRFWSRLDHIAQQMEDYSKRKRKPSDTSKLRAKKKVERQRRKKQQRLSRR